MNLFPKDKIFYNLFEKQAQKLNQAARLLEEILEEENDLKEISDQMKKLEEEADSVGHNIIEHLLKSFITPIGSEDIDLLRQELDNIMDYIERAVNRIVIYEVEPLPFEIEEYIEIIKQAITEINKGVKEIRNVRKFRKPLYYRCQKINQLENKGDQINRNALEKLMRIEPSPEKNLERMKLKEIYETLEEAIDRCEDVGNIFETILIKNR